MPALSCGSSASAGARPSTPVRRADKGSPGERGSERKPREGVFGQRPRWCFGAGAPVVGTPVIGPDGAAILATAEGYVHRLEPDGRYAWSYTLSAPPSGSPTVLSEGQVLVPTVSGLVYALWRNGRLAWRSRAPSPFMTGLATDAGGTSYVVARDRNVYSVSSRGRFFYRAKLPTTPFGDPLVVSKHDVAVLGVGGTIVRSRWAGRASRTQLENAPDQPLVSDGKGTLYALSSGLLQAFRTSTEPEWTRPGVAWVAVSNAVVVGTEQGEVLWLDPDTGAPTGRASCPEKPLAPPALAGPNDVLLPVGDRTLAVRRGVGVIGWLDSGAHRVLQLVYDEASARVLIVTEPGTLCSFDWPSPKGG